ncbi:hypothetical protein BGX28_008404 [Mortierella sp. GBA30]|nr:hypothetical protein BGX28_008404 [Mortierella sp. GBA30]
MSSPVILSAVSSSHYNNSAFFAAAMYPSGQSHLPHAQPHPYGQQPHPYASPQPQPQHQPYLWTGYPQPVSIGGAPATNAPPPPYQQHVHPSSQQRPSHQQYYTSPEPPRPNSGGHHSSYYQQQQQQQHASPPVSPYYPPQSSPYAATGVSAATVSLPATAPGGSAGFHRGSSPIPPTAAPTSAPAPALYKAEMTESQVHSWEAQRLHQQSQQNIKVEVSTSTAQAQPYPYKVPLSPSSLHAPALYSSAQQHKVPLDVHAELQHELKRQSQLLAMQHQRRPGSAGSTPVMSSAQTTWSQPIASHGVPTSPLPQGVSPTPVEHHSSWTDNTPSAPINQESSLTTLDPAPTAAAGIPTRVLHPYSSSQFQGQLNQPSAIEQQSSLTEIDPTTASSLTRPSRPFLETASISGNGAQKPFLNQGHSHSPPYSGQNLYPSAIEQQSSLTEVDNLPFPLEAQSSLTAVDDLPYAIEDQSALTVVDVLPHPLEEQSSLTVVDDLPYALGEQSALTEIDNLPHALSEQSALTVLDEPPSARSKPAVAATNDGVQPTEKRATTLSSVASNVTATSTATAGSEASDKATTEGVPLSPAMKALCDATTSFSMSNWSMPSDLNASSSPNNSAIRRDDIRRSPATIHVDTNLSDEEPSGHQTPGFESAADIASILIPLSPTTPGPNSPSPWKPQSTSDSLNKLQGSSPGGSTPPVPRPKPASLLAAKVNHPQSGSSGTNLTISEEIQLGDIIAPPAPAASLQLVVEQQVEVDSEEDEEEDIVKADDGVSAFIRELQSSITVPRSESTTSSLAGSAVEITAVQVKRNDSSSSRKDVHQSSEVHDKPAEQQARSITDHNQREQQTEAAVLEHYDSAQNLELQQLEATLFEWTFSDQEQSTYERIFNLWERPAEECVSADIAGKVFMTLGLMSRDLYKIWLLLNPEEKPVLSRTQFIAGLHLVNCKVVGYELPDDLPEELMISAASVGRIVIPPRPVQGPSALLPSVTASPPVTLPATMTSPVPAATPVPIPPVQERPAAGSSYSMASNFMHAYNVSMPGFSSEEQMPMLSNAETSTLDSGFAPPYVHYNQGMNQNQNQHQNLNRSQSEGEGHYQQQPLPSIMPQYPPSHPPAQQQQQYYPATMAPTLSTTTPVPKARNATSRSVSITSTVPSQNESETIIQPSKPGPHALHDLPADAPVMMSFEEPPRTNVPAPTISPSLSSSQSSASNSGTIVNLGITDAGTAAAFSSAVATTGAVAIAPSTATSTTTKVQNYYSVDNAALYASPPDAWDHDAAPPELDVEGSYIKYRSDFKNDMTVSASVTANHPINPKSGVFYFEIVIDRFKGNSAISVGIASKSLRKNCQVGWDLNSWGYHSDDGFLYFGNGKQNIKYSFEYNEGDTVGCGINFLDRAVFFTLNGDMLGVAFRFVKDSIPLYPAIGLSQAGTEINANFGDQTFLFNIVDYKKRVMSKPIHPQTFLTWNNGSRNEKVFQILGDGLSVIANGNDAGCIRGPKVSPRDKDVFYFEITILYMPPTEKGTIMVGMCGKDQNMKEILGWKPNSYGYSGECGDFLSLSSNRSSLNARSQSGKMKARARGPAFRAGSVVGCGVDFASRELFFTLNGECLGQAFYELDVLDCFPCVSVVDGGGGVGGPLSLAREQPLAANGTGVGGPGGDGRYGYSMTSKAGGVAGAGGTNSHGSNDKGGFEFKANFGQYPFMFDLPAFEASDGHY